jgi:hypothetical protein
MKHTVKDIEVKIKKLLADIKRAYYDHLDLVIESNVHSNASYLSTPLVNGWLIKVPVHDDQFNQTEPDYILILVDDDSGKIVSYRDGSMGRPVPMRAELNDEGKYKLYVDLS